MPAGATSDTEELFHAHIPQPGQTYNGLLAAPSSEKAQDGTGV